MSEVVALAGHVALVGLMGSGKTTVGRLAADELGVGFGDNDVALETRTGSTAAELAVDVGLDVLHDAELDALVWLLEHDQPLVVAAAASTIEARRGRLALARRAFVVWLHADTAVLAERAIRGRHRPLAGDVVAQLELQSQRRYPLYRGAADLIVDVGVWRPDAAAAQVAAAVRAAGRPVSAGDGTG